MKNGERIEEVQTPIKAWSPMLHGAKKEEGTKVVNNYPPHGTLQNSASTTVSKQCS